MPHCPVCDQPVTAWLPHPDLARRSEFCKLVGAVGSDLNVFQCPSCGCNDRDRHLWLYLQALGLPQQTGSLSILHMAPEPHIEQLLASLNPRQYLRGDLHPQRAGHLQIDLQALPFEDQSFNLILCNHVLEHVSDPRLALSEMYRCLVPGGILVAQTPYAPQLRYTLEMTHPVSAAQARLLFGQEDHVRLFGADITDYFAGAGFQGTPMAHAVALPGVEAAAAGINAQEPFFVFTR